MVGLLPGVVPRDAWLDQFTRSQVRGNNKLKCELPTCEGRVLQHDAAALGKDIGCLREHVAHAENANIWSGVESWAIAACVEGEHALGNSRAMLSCERCCGRACQRAGGDAMRG